MRSVIQNYPVEMSSVIGRCFNIEILQVLNGNVRLYFLEFLQEGCHRSSGGAGSELCQILQGSLVSYTS